MAISRRKGKYTVKLIISLILLSFFYVVPRFPSLVLASEVDPYSNSEKVTETDSGSSSLFERNFLDHEIDNNPDAILLRKHQLQLEKLEELVQNLTQLVSRLESRFAEAQVEIKKLPLSSLDDAIRDDEKIKEEQREEPALLKKYNTFWTERFHFLSAVKLRSSPTCINVLPFRDSEGLSKYFAVGDDRGKIYVFSRSGDVSLELNTLLDSRVSAMVSYPSFYKNETIIVTGHEDGNVVMHRIWETLSSEEWSSLHVERVVKFEIPESSNSKINILEVHNVGRKRYILATDGDGRIIVIREDGTVYGVAMLTRKPIVFLKQRLLFFTKTGAGSLDLRTMKLKEVECEGLNSSVVESYVFDVMDRSKAYGLTSEGDLIQTVLLGDMINFKCRVRSRRKIDLAQPLALQTIKGYLLILGKEKILAYNVSSQHYVRGSGLRLMFSADIDEIMSSFLNQQVADISISIDQGSAIPLIASDYEKHVVISLGNGYLAMYRSKLPIFKNEFNSILWTSPVLFFILFLFGAWHFFAQKKEALTFWGPDDPFNSSAPVTNGTPLASVPPAGDRAFADSSRNAEMMELRGSGLRGSSSSRYVSPPRYAGGPANSFRPGTDADSRSATVDPRFRTASELKFRGSNVESGKRRDTLFVNSQGVDEELLS